MNRFISGSLAIRKDTLFGPQLSYVKEEAGTCIKGENKLDYFLKKLRLSTSKDRKDESLTMGLGTVIQILYK